MLYRIAIVTSSSLKSIAVPQLPIGETIIPAVVAIGLGKKSEQSGLTEKVSVEALLTLDVKVTILPYLVRYVP